MSVRVIFSCDECFRETGPLRLESEFVSVSGRSYGFGSRICEQPKDKAPEGWVAYDIIGCTYCPDCASDLEEPPHE